MCVYMCLEIDMFELIVCRYVCTYLSLYMCIYIYIGTCGFVLSLSLYMCIYI